MALLSSLPTHRLTDVLILGVPAISPELSETPLGEGSGHCAGLQSSISASTFICRKGWGVPACWLVLLFYVIHFLIYKWRRIYPLSCNIFLQVSFWQFRTCIECTVLIFILHCSFLPHSRCWPPSACSILSQQSPASLDEAHRTPSSVHRLRLCSDPGSLASFWVWQAQIPWKFLNYFSWYKQLRPPEYLCVSH